MATAATGQAAESRRRLITEGYRALQAQFHAERADYGVSGQKYATEISGICEQMGIDVILDYGAGKETLAEALPQYRVVSYDPCIPHLAEPPEPHDLVVCTDVMEHIEPELVDNVLDDVARLAQKVVYFQIATSAASKVLPDGRNAHICIQPAEWWLAKLADRWDVVRYEKLGLHSLLATCVPYPKEEAANDGDH
jgi:hypothetical protein